LECKPISGGPKLISAECERRKHEKGEAPRSRKETKDGRPKLNWQAGKKGGH